MPGEPFCCLRSLDREAAERAKEEEEAKGHRVRVERRGDFYEVMVEPD